MYPKFKLSMQLLNNNVLSLSPMKIDENRKVIKEGKGTIIFNPSVQIEDDPTTCFHILTDQKAKCKTQAN